MGSYKKKLFIVLLLFLLISCFVCSSVNAVTSQEEVYNIDQFKFFENQQLYLSHVFFYYLQSSNITESQKEALVNNFKNKFYYFAFSNTTSSQFPNFVYVWFYDKNINFNYLSVSSSTTYSTEDSYFYDGNYVADESGYIINCSRSAISTYDSAYSTPANYNVRIPTMLIGYQNEYVLNFVNGVDFNSSPWFLLQQAIKENTEATEDTTQAVNQLRSDFNEEESDSDYDFPTSNPTTDPTSSGIDNIFNMFYMRINSWNALGINVPIPFTGKSFSISPDITENIINGWTPSTQIATVFKTLLSGVWYYLLGRYIVKDVQHYVDGLQTGDILTKSDTNIKTEML